MVEDAANPIEAYTSLMKLASLEGDEGFSSENNLALFVLMLHFNVLDSCLQSKEFSAGTFELFVTSLSSAR